MQLMAIIATRNSAAFLAQADATRSALSHVITSDDEVIEAIKNYDDDLYEKLNDMKYSEPIDKDEPYDSIGGYSVNDLERAFKNLKK